MRWPTASCAAVVLLAACDREPAPASPAATSAPAPLVSATRTPVDPALRFDEAFTGARPITPPNWRPTVGAEVIARFVDASWYTAIVLEVRPDKRKARLRWGAGTGDDRDVPLVDLAPVLPGVDAPGLALARPDGHGRWLPVEVVSVAGEEAEIADRNGQRRRVPRSDLVALRH
jgi:hypothetical protein